MKYNKHIKNAFNIIYNKSSIAGNNNFIKVSKQLSFVLNLLEDSELEL